MENNEIDKELVTRKELETFIGKRKQLEPYSDFLKNRWVKMVMWWHNRSEEAKEKYFMLRAIIIIGGVMIPVLSALNINKDLAPYTGIATAVVGAIVAGCAAWEGFANYSGIWLEKRKAAELLKVEGWKFFQRCDKYRIDNKDDKPYDVIFPVFAAEVERMIAGEVGEYAEVFASSIEQNKAQAKKIMDSLPEVIVEKMKEKNIGEMPNETEGKTKK